MAGANWEHVVYVNSYHVEYTPEVQEVVLKLFRHYVPDNPLVWTTLGVASLADPRMRVEMRFTAIIP